MRIGLLTTSFPRAEGDIPGQFVLGFARALAARGHTLEVLAPEPHELAYVTPPSFEGIDVHWVRYAPRALERTFYGAGVLDNLRRDPRAWLGLVPFIAALTQAARERVSRWDALVSHWALPCALVAGLVRGSRPHLAVLHSADVFVLEHLPLRRQLAEQIARGADACVCSSRKLRERFLAQLEPVLRVEAGARTHVCAMGIEPAPTSRHSEPPPRDRLVLLSLGRLVEIKGLEHAIRAVLAVPDVELVIAGDGPLRGELERLARPAKGRIRFVGEVHGAAKHALFRAAHAFVLPSIALASGRTEGMPTTLLEAMDHGLPVIASDTGGTADIVEHDYNGLLVKAGDTAAISAAIAQLRERPLRARLGTKARKTAAQFHWSELGPRFEALLTDALPIRQDQ
jgi:glycosyltransferase involved in cell wall biosynthesis